MKNGTIQITGPREKNQNSIVAQKSAWTVAKTSVFICE
jgi:hypothetical protein